MNSSTLRNPSEEDFKLEEQQPETQENYMHSEDQLAFDVDSGTKIAGMFAGVKMNLRKQNDFLEISQLWKSPAPSFALVSLITILGILIIGGIFKYNDLGPTIPLLYDSINKQFIASDKIFIFLSAIAVAILEAIIFRFIILISKDDRRLSIVMSWIVFFCNLMILIGIGQVYTIII